MGSYGEQDVHPWPDVMMVLSVSTENSEKGKGDPRGRASGATGTGISYGFRFSGPLPCLWEMSFELLTYSVMENP